jgi:hypothetical protein
MNECTVMPTQPSYAGPAITGTFVHAALGLS